MTFGTYQEGMKPVQILSVMLTVYLRVHLSPVAIIFKNSFQLSSLFLQHYNNTDSWSMVRFLLNIVHEFKQMLLKPFIVAFKSHVTSFRILLTPQLSVCGLKYFHCIPISLSAAFF